MKSSLANPALPPMFVRYSPAMALSCAAAANTWCLVEVVVVGGLRHHCGCAVAELHDLRHGQLVLVVSQVQEHAIFHQRAAERSAELALLLIRLTADVRRLRIEIPVANVEESGAVPVVPARICHYVEHCPACAAQLGAVAVRRHAELLDHLVAELIRRAIASAGLCVEAVVIVGAVHQIAVLVAARPAVRQSRHSSRRSARAGLGSRPATAAPGRCSGVH